jgi:hypothetical protein
MNIIMNNDETIQSKHEKFLKIRQNAIDILKKRIAIFEGDPEYKVTVEDLRNGLSVLEAGYERVKKEGSKGLEQNLIKHPKGGKRARPGLGLSRGFGEFLLAIDEEWTNEVLDAVYAIEDYWRKM